MTGEMISARIVDNNSYEYGGHFVLEAKKLRQFGKAFDDAMLRARSQAEQYARALPADEGCPPFLVVVDVGNAIELYSEFTLGSEQDFEQVKPFIALAYNKVGS